MKNKNYFRKTISLLLSVIFILAVSGCSSNSADLTQNTGTQETSTLETREQQTSQDVSTGFPIKITDATATEVTIEKKPVKIISLTLGTDEILLEIASKDNIKAISYLSEDTGLSNIVEEAKSISEKLNLEPEKVISLQPDIVFVADWTDEKFIKQLRDAGIVVYAYVTPNNILEQEEMIRIVGRLVGEYDNAVKLVDDMEEKLNAIKDKVSTIKETDRLTALKCENSLFVYGSQTTYDDIIMRAGLINAAAEAGIVKWQQISKEKIVEMDPGVLLLPSWSYKDFDASAFAEDFKNDVSLAGVSAIKNNRVFMLPEAHMTAISQYVVLGVEDAAKAAYPELFK
jgi:iron complex transport system substrate-binding protein